MLRLTTAASIAATALLIAGCGTSTITISTTTPPPASVASTVAASPAEVPPGTPVTADGATLIVHSVAYHPGPTGPIGRPAQNGQYAVANVEIDATSGQFTYNPFYVRYQGADGTVYMLSDGNAATAGYGPALTFGTLAPGESTRGTVTFDVPPGHGQDVQIVDAVGDTLGEWTLR